MAHEQSHQSVVTDGSRGHGATLRNTKKEKVYDYTKLDNPEFEWNHIVDYLRYLRDILTLDDGSIFGANTDDDGCSWKVVVNFLSVGSIALPFRRSIVDVTTFYFNHKSKIHWMDWRDIIMSLPGMFHDMIKKVRRYLKIHPLLTRKEHR